MKKAWLLLCLCLLLCGCDTPSETDQIQSSVNRSPAVEQGEPAAVVDMDIASLFSDRDREGTYDEAHAVVITLSGSSAQSDGRGVTVAGSAVTITGEGVYVLRGSLEGTVTVDVDKSEKVQLVLDGAAVAAPVGAAIYVAQADKVFLTLVGENRLESSSFGEDNVDGTVFSREDLTINGAGSLTVVSPAGHGVVSKDELTVTGGSFTIQCAGHGLEGKDSVAIAGGSFVITSGKDGIHGENDEDAALGYVYIEKGDFVITAEGDGISAGACMQIDGGSFDILCGGGAENAQQKTSTGWGGMGGGRGSGGGMEGPGGPGGFGGMGSLEEDTTEDSTSIKGIKAVGELVINGGSFTMDCADDAIHTNSSLTVCGGTFDLATGDDGFHADEALTISAGTIAITESYEGLEGLSVTVSGGDITLKATDDGINAAGGTDQSGFGGKRGGDKFGGMGGGSSDSFIRITGGTIYMNASGDGIDSNGTLEISGGHTTVCGPTQGDTAVLDYDLSGTITGGTFIGTGSYMMAQTFSASEQGVVALSVGNQAAGTRITLSDSTGQLVEYVPALNYAILIVSTPEMVKGETYTVTVGELSGEFEAN